MSDPLVVSTEALREAILIWSKGKGFPKNRGDQSKEHLYSLSHYLERESTIPKRRIWGIMKKETKVTTLETADKIITAMERPDLMPEAIANPRWNHERWVAYMQERGCY